MTLTASTDAAVLAIPPSVGEFVPRKPAEGGEEGGGRAGARLAFWRAMTRGVEMTMVSTEEGMEEAASTTFWGSAAVVVRVRRKGRAAAVAVAREKRMVIEVKGGGVCRGSGASASASASTRRPVGGGLG